MLIKGFYHVISKQIISDDVFHVTIKLHEEHAIFKGHFPENPITPGVCMVQILKEITENHFKCTLFLQKISNIKFTALINPFINSELVLEITTQQVDNTIKVKNISKFVQGTIALKCNGTFVIA
ncbi:3-hydroxyacyl-ACP dehydratase [Polaribacter sp.]|uniref:3-hydroxyacyl-ACP dehydratase n=1 Tax=Polaribacter sp. TaxID=1920175 RepID=UPI003EF797F5